MTAPPSTSRRRDDHQTGVALPRLLWVPAALAFALIALPVVGLAIRTDWPRLPALLLSESALDALRLSLGAVALAALLSLVVTRGLPTRSLAESGDAAADGPPVAAA